MSSRSESHAEAERRPSAAEVPAGAGRRPRARRVSRTRQLFLNAIHLQIGSARVLALAALLTLLLGGAYWLVGTTGSPVIGVSLLVLAVALGVAVYWFVQLMQVFAGRR